MSTSAALASTARRLRVAAGLGSVDSVPSPCVSVCQMNAVTGLCAGCLRTLDEIATWGAMEEGGKIAVWRRIEARALAPDLSGRASKAPQIPVLPSANTEGPE